MLKGHKNNCQCCVCKAERGEMKGKNHPMYGRKHSKKTKQKIGKANKEKHLRKSNNLEIILDENVEAYYWVGFLAADGSFTRDKKRVRLCLREFDYEQIKKFCKFIEWDGVLKKSYVAVMDSDIIPKLCKKFGLKPNKTYHPPKTIPTHNKKLRFAYSVGYIDGDGSIIKRYGRKGNNRKYIRLEVKCHSSWEKMLRKIVSSLGESRNVVHINKEGYVRFEICDFILLKEIKRKIIQLKLPVLSRKWEKIDLNFVNRTEKAREHVKIVERELKRNSKQRDIAIKLGIGDSAISHIIQKNHLRR